VRDQLLDLALRLVPCGLEDRLVVLWCQMRRKQRNGRQCECPLGELIEKQRETSRGPRRFDAAVRGVLGQVQDLRAVREE
jgi:hypothetical protein